MRLIRERRDYYWNWSDSEGWQSQFDQKDLQEGEESLDLQAGQIGKVSFPVEWGSYRLGGERTGRRGQQRALLGGLQLAG